jgi:DNA topoisomerase VI subunit A
VVLRLLASQQVITKRNLYYKLIHYYANKYAMVDSDIEIICFNVGITREQLGILSSSKCLIMGSLVVKYRNNELRCQPTIITNIPTSDDISISSTSCKILIIV